MALVLELFPHSIFLWVMLAVVVVAAGASVWAAALSVQVRTKTRELQLSLEMKRKAAEFDVARNEVLESIVRNAPLPETMERLAVAIERQMEGAMCVIVMQPDGRLSADNEIGPVVVAPTLREEIHPEIIGVLSPMLVAPARLDELKQTEQRNQVFAKLREILGTAGHNFEDAEFATAFSGSGSVAGLVLLLLPGRVPLPTEIGFQRMLQSASRLLSLAKDQYQMHERLVQDARHDNLTGLANRVVAEDRLEQALARAVRRKQRFALIYIDLDGFKAINDELGHDAGDEVLRSVAAKFRSRIRLSDTLARLGGDEFLAVVEDCSTAANAYAIAQSLLAALRDPITIAGRQLLVSGSMGIAMYPEDGTNASQLKRNADLAMYRAKAKNGSKIAAGAGSERVGQSISSSC